MKKHYRILTRSLFILGISSILLWGCEKETKKTDPVISWSKPDDINYGTLLGVRQLNATADVEGTFVYSPPTGTKLNEGNNQTLSVTFTPDDPKTYNSATKTVQINVLEAAVSDGIWSGKYNNNLELSIIINDKKITRVDVVYKTSDLDYQSSSIKDETFGPIAIGKEISFDISSSTTINSNSVDVKVNVSLTFSSETKASGQIVYSENNAVKNTSAIEINWKEEIPNTGFIRDGSWSGGITDPIIVYFSFDITNGTTGAITYLYMDSQTFGMGTTYGNNTASIGSNFEFSISSGIDVSITFSSYMIGNGTMLLDLVGGDESIPVECTWSPDFPDSKKKSTSEKIEQNALGNRFPVDRKNNIRGCLKKRRLK